ncbi:MAG: hypothetical protein EZS28_015153 [Streblomastix strix]|uniref:Uncharacterized protein n=1 Tax=Streblomastix strix TaxID=222440 RepID=A0A5J4W3T0_9EUKA|nr:MAG: hypothetical protein EZS28_015153 [Streblomastix strix]
MLEIERQDSLKYFPKFNNQYLKHQQVQSYQQQNKSQDQKRKVQTKRNYRTNQSELQLMEQMTMENKTNLSTQSNPYTSLTETMVSEGMTAGCSYRPLSMEMLIPRDNFSKISANTPFNNVN